MLIHRFVCIARIVMKIFVMVAIGLPLVSLAPAGATEKANPQTAKRKSVVKKDHQRVNKAAKQKKTKAHPHKTGQKKGAARNTSAKFVPASLTLAKNIDSAASASTVRAVPLNRPVNPTGSKPSLEETAPPLQIGKTLYQRNGEIRQLESQ